jgi:hypothetical protein
MSRRQRQASPHRERRRAGAQAGRAPPDERSGFGLFLTDPQRNPEKRKFKYL